jgi:hypothetical protein
MIHVVAQACHVENDRSKCIVVLESDNKKNFPGAIEELSSTDARNIALAHARTLISNPRMNGSNHPYPVNSQGYPLDQLPPDVAALPPTAPQRQPAVYRIDIPIAAQLL